MPATPPSPPAADRAYAHVKEEILTGRLPGGHLFSEGDVAGRLGISRTPVREALLRLQGDGLVELIPKRGAVVIASSGAEARDVRDLRLAVELAAVERIAADGRSTEPLLATLAELIAEQEDLRAAGDLAGFLLADARFHHAIVAGSGNALAARIYQPLSDRQRRINLLWLEPAGAGIDALIADHRALRAALAEPEPAAYAELLRAHLERSTTALGAPRG